MMSALRETGLHQLRIAYGYSSTGDGFLSMDCASSFGHRRAEAFTPSPITGFDVVSTVYILRQLTNVFHRISQFPSTVINDDMDSLCRFVSECMTGPAQLRAAMMQDWGCFQGAVTRRASYGMNSIPARHSVFCRLGMDEEDNSWQISWRDLPLSRRDANS